MNAPRRQRYWDYPSKTTITDIIGAAPDPVWILEGPALTIERANHSAAAITPEPAGVAVDEAFDLSDPYRPLVDAAYECFGSGRTALRRIVAGAEPAWGIALLRLDDQGRKVGVSLVVGTDSRLRADGVIA